MNEERTLDRREFTLMSALAVLSGVTITISGCGSSSTGPSATSGDLKGVVSENHGHTATITSAQLTKGDGVSLDIRGGADHNHTVTLSAAQIQQLAPANRTPVSTQSSSDNGHLHTITFG